MGNQGSSSSFSTTLPVTVLVMPADELDSFPPSDIVGTSNAAWQILDRGPGYFHIPDGMLVGVRMKGIDDRTLSILASDLAGYDGLQMLNLAENRNVTDAGLAKLPQIKSIEFLNLSSCDITARGLTFMKELPGLSYLDLSYCNRINDTGIKHLHSVNSLAFINLQACFQVTQAGMSKLARRGLEIRS